MRIDKKKRVLAFLLAIVMVLTGMNVGWPAIQVEAAGSAYTIRAEVPDDWLDSDVKNGTPYIYVWKGAVEPAGAWPGTQMTSIDASENLYGFTFGAAYSDVTEWNMIIANIRNTDHVTEQGRVTINDVSRTDSEKSIYYVINKYSVVDGKNVYKYYSQEDADPTKILDDTSNLEDFNLFAKAPASWGDEVYVYTWKTGNHASAPKAWPGEKCDLIDASQHLYGFKLPNETFTNIVINNGAELAQTADIKNVTTENGKCYLYNVELSGSEISKVTKTVFTRVNQAMIYFDNQSTGSFVYDGTVKTPVITVKDGEKDVTASCTISGTKSQTNAGTYTVTVKGDDITYIQSADKTWEITKRPVTITAKPQTIDEGGAITKTLSDVTVSGLADGQTLKSITLTADEGTKKITPSAAVIEDGSHADVTVNYEVSYEKGTLTVNSEHTHDWKYASKENTIEAWCEGSGSCSFQGTAGSHANAVKLTLSAPDELVYDGTKTFPVKVTKDAGYPGSDPAVTYTGTTLSGASYNSTEAPKEAGTYTASATANGQTATLSYTVAPKTIDALAVTGLTVPKKNQTFDPAAIECEVTGVKDSPAVIFTTKDGAEVAGTAESNTEYVLKVTLQAENNYQFADSAAATVNGNSGASVTKNTDGTVTVAYTFKTAPAVDSVIAPDDFTFTKGYASKEEAANSDELPSTVKVRVEDAEHGGTKEIDVPVTWSLDSYDPQAAKTNEFTFTIDKAAAQLAPYDLSALADGWNTGTISVKNKGKADQAAPDTLSPVNATSEETADGKIQGVDSSMEYRKKGDTDYTPITGEELTDLTPGVYQVRYAETPEKNASPDAFVTIGIKGKENQNPPDNLKPVNASSETAEDGKIQGVDTKMEYRKKGDMDYTPITGEELTGLAPGVYYVRYAETPTKNASPDASVNVGVKTKENQDAPDHLTPVNASSENAADGKIQGVDSTMEYRKMGAADYSPITGEELANLTPGVYQVRRAETETKNASPNATVTVGYNAKTNQAAPTGLTTEKASSPTAEDGKIKNVTPDMEYRKKGDAEFIKITGTELTGLMPGDYEIRTAGDADKNPSPVTEVAVGAKTNQSAPTGLKAEDASSKTAADGKIKGVQPGMEYRKAGSTEFTPISGSEITGLTPGDYEVRAAGDADKNPSDSVKVTVGAKEGFTVTPDQKKAYEMALNSGLEVSQTGSQIKIKWGKVTGADGYEVYATYCGKQFSYKPNKKTKTNKVTSVIIKKINGKKLNLKKNYKIFVTAYKNVDGQKVILGRTITGHIVGRKNTSYTNVKEVKVAKTKVKLHVGKSYTIKAKTVLVHKRKKQLTDDHAKEFRYASTDESVATVSKKGKITAKGKGTCSVYVYARNGYAKKIKVTVK